MADRIYLFQVNATDPAGWKEHTAASPRAVAEAIATTLPPGAHEVYVELDPHNRWPNGVPRHVNKYTIAVGQPELPVVVPASADIPHLWEELGLAILRDDMIEARRYGRQIEAWTVLGWEVPGVPDKEVLHKLAYVLDPYGDKRDGVK